MKVEAMQAAAELGEDLQVDMAEGLLNLTGVGVGKEKDEEVLIVYYVSMQKSYAKPKRSAGFRIVWKRTAKAVPA